MLVIIPCLSVVGIGANLCVNRVVTETVKEIHNEWYGSVDVTEMDTVSVLNDMIDTLQYNTINNLYCAEYLTKLSLRDALQV